jgi:hypothetical protein
MATLTNGTAKAPINLVETRATPAELREPDIKIYSHSPILYWWPVWLVGFVLALVTYLDGGLMAYVPAGTRVEANQLTAPAGAALEVPQERIAGNPYLGTVFFLVLLVVFVVSNVPLRGLWEGITVLALALAFSTVSLYGLWDPFLDWFGLVHVHINLAGYLFLSTCLLVIWLAAVFVFDHRTYIIFAAGQVRIRDQMGQAEKVYDVTNMTFKVLPNVFLRHRVLGFYGAGDLIVRPGGPGWEVLEWPNVLFARSRVKAIERRLKSREVV